MKRFNTILLPILLLCSCYRVDDSFVAEGDAVKACEEVAKSSSKLLADESDDSAAYRSALDECQTRLGSQKLTPLGAKYANCIVDAESGSEVMACNKDMTRDFIDEKVKKMEGIAVEVWKEICDGKVEEDDPRLKEIQKLEDDARSLGLSSMEINTMLDRVREKSGCDM